jgi:hypothetical protein
VLGDPAVGSGPGDLEHGELDRLAGALVRAVGGDPLGQLVTRGELVFHDGVEIWKDPKGTGQPVQQAGRAWRELGAGYMVNAGGGHELVGDREIALVEDLFD